MCRIFESYLLPSCIMEMSCPMNALLSSFRPYFDYHQIDSSLNISPNRESWKWPGGGEHAMKSALLLFLGTESALNVLNTTLSHLIYRRVLTLLEEALPLRSPSKHLTHKWLLFDLLDPMPVFLCMRYCACSYECRCTRMNHFLFASYLQLFGLSMIKSIIVCPLIIM